MNKIVNFCALISALSFIVLMRIEFSSFASELSAVAFKISTLSLAFFGSFYLYDRFYGEQANLSFSLQGRSENMNEQKIINTEFLKLQLCSIPAYLAFGFGVYCLYVNDPGHSSTHFSYGLFCYGLIFVGICIEIVLLAKVLPLLKERAELLKSG